MRCLVNIYVADTVRIINNLIISWLSREQSNYGTEVMEMIWETCQSDHDICGVMVWIILQDRLTILNKIELAKALFYKGWFQAFTFDVLSFKIILRYIKRGHISLTKPSKKYVE